MKVVETFTTPNDKEIQIFIDESTAQHRVQFKSGGELPVELTGIFTSAAIARVAVQSYLGKNQDKFEKRASNKKLEEEIKESIKED